MGLTVEIDSASGFCAGVIGAITKAEDFLEKTRKDGENRKLFSLGTIVHNDQELQRLERQGLVSIDKDDLDEIREVDGETLLIRAHGEPPETFALAGDKGFRIIDCTCPVVLKLQERIREAHARLTMDGRKGQIIRVIVNLLSNALQAVETRGGGYIRISISSGDGKYTVSFEDNGPGVKEEDIDKLFKPNFTTKTGGTGLGLAISRNIIEQSGGTIYYRKSELGGANFSFTLPLFLP